MIPGVAHASAGRWTPHRQEPMVDLMAGFRKQRSSHSPKISVYWRSAEGAARACVLSTISLRYVVDMSKYSHLGRPIPSCRCSYPAIGTPKGRLVQSSMLLHRRSRKTHRLYTFQEGHPADLFSERDRRDCPRNLLRQSCNMSCDTLCALAALRYESPTWPLV